MKRFNWLPMGIAVLAILSTARGQTNAPSAAPVRFAPASSYYIPLAVDPAVFDSPYNISLFKPQSGEDSARLWSQTKSLYVYGVGVVLVLAAMPSDITGWETEDNIFEKWITNVKEGPRWDRDDWYFNYIGHTYCGGVFYQVARKSGYRQWDSFLYATLLSTFYWEYGVEAFAEVPSIQDLVVTPVLGWVYGEWAYQTEMGIRGNNNEVLGSRILGGASLFLLDPIDSLGNGVNRLVGRKWIKSGYGYFTYLPVDNQGTTDHQVYLHMKFPIGASGPSEPDRTKLIQAATYDPVDTGIVGFSVGSSYQIMDSDWNMEDGWCTKATLGLYFTPRSSLRLAYTWGSLEEKGTIRSRTHEKYSLDGQYYLNPKGKVRPYVTAGFGEQLWEEDTAQKTFQLNGGLGLHWRVHRKISLNADWIGFVSMKDETVDQSVSAGLTYRFGQGEHSNWY
ncbi:DUF3943 domain-containing protein [Pontiella desulfatans]|uniref:DUF3943 domain-containing protein n=1 Tax=Pontiella desulfatans TaxID=2750659 RepID=UPI00109D4832|nr:DUF3943 domain-containing protein [Pontiella desulfatans]